DVVYGADGGLQGGLDAVERRRGYQCRNGDREPHPERSGRTDRILCQYARDENRPRRQSEFQRVDQEGERGGARSLRAPGSTVREAGGGYQSGTRPEPESLVSGADDAAKHEAGRGGDQRAEDEWGRGRDWSGKIRSGADSGGRRSRYCGQ